MKKIILAVAFAATSAAAVAQNIEAVFHFPAGGGHDNATAALWTAVEKTGTPVKKVYYKSCAEAIDHVKKTPNSFLVSDSGSINLEGATSRCPDAAKNNIKLASLVTSAGVYLCVPKSNINLTVEDLKGDKTYKVGSVKYSTASGALEVFLKNINSKSRVIPYTTMPELRAAVSSKDVDFMFASNGVPELLADGGKCLAASSSKNTTLKLPSLASFTKDGKFPEYLQTTAIFTAHPNPALSKIIKQAMETKEFQESVAKRQGIHLGLGSSNSLADQQKIFANDYTAADVFSK